MLHQICFNRYMILASSEILYSVTSNWYVLVWCFHRLVNVSCSLVHGYVHNHCFSICCKFGKLIYVQLFLKKRKINKGYGHFLISKEFLVFKIFHLTKAGIFPLSFLSFLFVYIMNLHTFSFTLLYLQQDTVLFLFLYTSKQLSNAIYMICFIALFNLYKVKLFK